MDLDLGRQSIVDWAESAPEEGAADFVPAKDKYKIEAPIGKGGMGEVFLATDKDLRRQVAMKMLRKDAGGGRDNWCCRRVRSGTRHHQYARESTHEKRGESRSALKHIAAHHNRPRIPAHLLEFPASSRACVQVARCSYSIVGNTRWGEQPPSGANYSDRMNSSDTRPSSRKGTLSRP